MGHHHYTIFNGKTHYKWQFSIASSMFTTGYSKQQKGLTHFKVNPLQNDDSKSRKSPCACCLNAQNPNAVTFKHTNFQFLGYPLVN